MVEILKTIFKTNPKKPKVLKSQCSDCGKALTINITSTSGGFGIQGGAFLECSPNSYLVKCIDCYKVNSKINHVV